MYIAATNCNTINAGLLSAKQKYGKYVRTYVPLNINGNNKCLKNYYYDLQYDNNTIKILRFKLSILDMHHNATLFMSTLEHT